MSEENFKSPEVSLAERIRRFVEVEDVPFEDVVSDAKTYLELLQDNQELIGFFEIISEAVDAPVGEIIEFFRNLE